MKNIVKTLSEVAVSLFEERFEKEANNPELVRTNLSSSLARIS